MFRSRFALIVIFFIVACTFTRTTKNLEEDRKSGKAFATLFYEKLKKKETLSLLDKASDSLRKSVGDTTLLNNLNTVQTELGDLKKYDIAAIETQRVEKNGIATVTYTVKIKADYPQGHTNEVLSLIKIDKNDIQFRSFSVNQY